LLLCLDGGGATNADRLKLYINGSLVTLTYTGTIPSQTGTMLGNGLHSGARVTGSGAINWGFEGNIDEVSIFDSAISIGDVWDGSGQPVDVSTVSGLKQYYKMGEDANFTSNWLVDNSALDNYSKRSFDFDAVDGYIDCGNSTVFNLTNTMTLSAWINPSIATADDFIIAKRWTSNAYQMATNGSNKPSCSIWIGGVRYNAYGTTTLTPGTWYNIIVTFDGLELKIYTNGVLEGTTSASGTIDINTDSLTIGKGLNSSIYNFNGLIDEVAIFDSAISISDVWDGSGEPIDVSAVSGIVSNYRMGEDASFNGTNWTVPDQAGTNTGTSANMTVDDLVGEAPNYSGGGISSGMTIEDRVGNAPNSENNALSINMEREDRTTDVPI